MRVFQGHTDAVRSVCLSLDGKWALSGSQDKTVRLWEVGTGQCVKTFEEHKSRVLSVNLSADAGWAFAGTADHKVAVWFLDWDLEEEEPGDRDQGASALLLNFITSHTPYVGTLSATPSHPSHLSDLSDPDKNDAPGLWHNVVRKLSLWFKTAHPPEKLGAKAGKAGARGTPNASPVPLIFQPTEQEIESAFTRHGVPTWTEDDFSRLLYTLGCAGYGCIRPEAVRKQLDKMASPLRGRGQ